MECSLQVLKVLLHILVEYQDIIKKYQDELAKVRPKEIIHGSLEGEWCICQAKWRNNEFIVAGVCAKGCFVYIKGLHTDLTVARAQVSF